MQLFNAIIAYCIKKVVYLQHMIHFLTLSKSCEEGETVDVTWHHHEAPTVS